MITTPATRAATQVDLRSPDFLVRRRRLLDALQDLAPGEEILVITAAPDDLRWLAVEAEARTGRGYRWSQPGAASGEVRATVRLR